MSAMSTVFKGLVMSAAPEVDAMTLRGAQSTRQDAVSVAQLEALASNEESSIFKQSDMPAGFKPLVTITHKEEGKEDKKFGLTFSDHDGFICIQVYCLKEFKKWVPEGDKWGYFVNCDEPSRKEFQKFREDTNRKNVFTLGEPQAVVWRRFLECLEKAKQGGAKFSIVKAHRDGDKESEGQVRLTTKDKPVVIIDLKNGTVKLERED